MEKMKANLGNAIRNNFFDFWADIGCVLGMSHYGIVFDEPTKWISIKDMVQKNTKIVKKKFLGIPFLVIDSFEED